MAGTLVKRNTGSGEGAVTRRRSSGRRGAGGARWSRGAARTIDKRYTQTMGEPLGAGPHPRPSPPLADRSCLRATVPRRFTAG